MATPIRVKLYGLFWMTKRRYIAQLVLAGVLCSLLLGVWFFLWRDQRKGLDLTTTLLLDFAIRLWDLVPLVVLVIAALQAIEAVFVFRAFARKEAESASAPAPAPPSETPPA